MSWRGVAWLFAVLVVSGCVTERQGLDFTALSQKVGPPKPGLARIVVFREKAYAGLIDQGWDVKLDGEPLSDLKTGTYVYLDRPAGHHKLSSSAAMFPGETQVEVNVVPGRTYFFLARVSERAQKLNAMSAAAGLTGLVVASAMTANDSNPGPLDFFPIEETAARTMIVDLRLAEASAH